jgi:septation ring formation regulator EzrA
MNRDEEYNAFKKDLESALERMVESYQYEFTEDIVAEAIEWVNDWSSHRIESEAQEARERGVSLNRRRS